jgi:putative transport protein
MDSEILGVIRKISLTFFLAIIGLRYGFDVFQAVASAGTILAGIGIIVGSMAILSGFLIGRYIFRINWIMLAGAICGGMTSTPGLGAAIEALDSNDPAAGYGATYPFALMGVVIFTIIMHLLPI